MAAYAVPDDMLTYIDQTSLVAMCDDADTGAYDDGVKALLAKLIADQQTRIDSAMKAAGYIVPTAAPGDMLRSLTCRLSLSAVYSRRPIVTPPEALKEVTAAAELELKLLAQDKAFVPEGVRAQFLNTVTPFSISSDADRGWSDSELF